MISQEHGEYLLNIAKKAVKTYLETGEQILVPEDCPEELKEKLGVFVTLNKNNQLRGCIGYPEPIESAISINWGFVKTVTSNSRLSYSSGIT